MMEALLAALVRDQGAEVLVVTPDRKVQVWRRVQGKYLEATGSEYLHMSNEQIEYAVTK